MKATYLCLLLVCIVYSASHGTIINRYVNTESAGGNGTTSALSGTNAAYTHLVNAINEYNAYSQTNLDTFRILCAGKIDNIPVVINDKSVYGPLEIIGELSNGIFDTSKYNLNITSDTAMILSRFCCRLLNLQIKSTGPHPAIFCNQPERYDGFVWIAGCIIQSERHGIYAEGRMSKRFNVFNNIIYNKGSITGSYGLRLRQNAECVARVYNNTISRFGAGVYMQYIDSCYLINNGFVKCTVDTSSYNGYQTKFVYTTNSTMTPVFSTSDTTNFHLSSTDAVWRNKGTNNVDTSLYTIDIDNDPRSGQWDIGADEYAVLGMHISSSSRDSGVISGGQEVIYNGINFGNASGNLRFGNQQITVSSWRDTQMIFITPPHSVGTVKVYVTNSSTTQVDSSKTFTYYSLQGRRLFVDSVLTKNILSGHYSIANRDSSGIDGMAFTNVQAAVDSMKPGDTILIRSGHYYEMNIYIGGLNNGSDDKWYTIKSYRDEWAIIDGRYDTSSATSHSNIFNGYIFRGTTANGAQGYIRFERLEITGGGLDTNAVGYPLYTGGGIKMRGGPFQFRYLYVHNNYGGTSENNGGLVLENGTGGTLIEYCRFKANGDVRGSTTSSANLVIFSDYKYENPIVSVVNSTTGYYISSVKNIISYNLFEADAGSGQYTVTGFKQKGMQRLTGYNYVDTRNSLDAVPNDTTFRSFGDKIYKNIFLGHEVGIEVDQDYVQVYNNIIKMKNWNRAFADADAIQLRDQNANRRGPFEPCVYNNTLICIGKRGILHHPVPQGWTGGTPIMTKCYIQNNVIDSAKKYAYNIGQLTVASDNVTTTGYDLSTLHLDRNYFYRSDSDSLVFVHSTYYSKAAIQTSINAIVYNRANAGDLYLDSLRTNGSHILSGSTTIANGGIGGNHPYLAGINIPNYIGANDPTNGGWVDTVLALKGTTLNPAKVPVTITVQPQPVSVNIGQVATFCVTATGTGLNYQWRRAEVNITGATSDCYNMTPAYTDSGVNYSVIVTGDTLGPVISDNALLTVHNICDTLNDTVIIHDTIFLLLDSAQKMPAWMTCQMIQPKSYIDVGQSAIERKDYAIDYSGVLEGDYIITSTWSGPSEIVLSDDEFNLRTTKVFISGGTDEMMYNVKNRIHTAYGRVIEFTIQVFISTL